MCFLSRSGAVNALGGGMCEDASFLPDAEAARHLMEALAGCGFKNPGLAVCLADDDGVSAYAGHSVDVCGWGDEELAECVPCEVLGFRLWMQADVLRLLSCRVLTVIHAGTPRSRARVVIQGMSEPEVRAGLCDGAF